MKRIIKIVATLITLIIVNYNMCFADTIAPPMILDQEGLLIIALILALIFILGMILITIEIVTYIYKKKKSEETHKIEDIINKTAISLALLGSFYILLYSFTEEFFWGRLLLIGSIISIIARKTKKIKLSNIVCALVILFSIISFFFLIDMSFRRAIVDKTNRDNKIPYELEIEQFNSKFTQYEGDNVKGSTVNTMLQAVVANNLAQDDETRQVEVYFSENCKDRSGNNVQNLEKTSTSAPRIATSRTYKVRCNMSNKGENEYLVQSIEVECNEKNK